MVSAGATVEHVVVGIGINVNATDFPPELADRATSLRAALGRAVDARALLAAVLNAFEPLLRRLRYAAARRPRSTRSSAHAALPERCRVDDRLQGVGAGRRCRRRACILRDDAGRIHRVVSGEIQT